MEKHHHKHYHFLSWLALAVFTAILLVSVWYIVQDVVQLRTEGYFRSTRHYIRRANPDQIRSWMTFNYINKLFNLPPAYLKSELGITMAKYPNVSISSLASQQNQNLDTEVAKVQDAVRAYLNPNKIK